MQRPSFLAATLGACLVLVSPHSLAQTQRSGGSSQQATQQLQQLASERAAAQAEAAKAKQSAADLSKQLAQVTAERDTLKARAAGAAAAQGAKERELADDLEQNKVKLAELVRKFRETATALREVEANRNQVRSEMGTLSRDYQTCVEHNAELSTLTRDALERYAGVGGLRRAEPFTRISRTRAENLADEYRARLDDLKVRRNTPAAASSVPSDPTESDSAPR